MRPTRLVALLVLASCKHRAPPAPAPAPSASAPESSAALVQDDAGPLEPAAPREPPADGPSAAQLAKMRTTFHAAVSVEASEPARAVTLYEQSFAVVPTLAALLGEARAATAKGDAALSTKSLARALAFAERSGDAPRVAVTAQTDDKVPRVLDVEKDFALLSMNADRLVVRQDLATGALGVILGLPESASVFAASPHLAVVKVPGSGTSVLSLGVDDATTAEPLDALALATGAAISRDESLVGAMTDSGAVVIDARTHQTLGKARIGAQTKRVLGFTQSGKRLVVLASDRVCVLSAPAWNECSPTPTLRGVNRPEPLGAVGGELVAFAPNDTTFRVFDTEVSRTEVTLTGHFASVDTLSLSPDGATLLSSSFSRTVTWDVATHARHDLPYEDRGFQPVYSTDGKHLLDAQDNAVLVRDASALSVWMPIVAAGSFPVSWAPPVVLFAPSGNLWVGGNRFVARLDLRAGTLRSYPIYGAAVDLAVAPDEAHFGVGDSFGNMGSNVYVYDANSGKQLSTNPGGMLGDMHFSGDKLVVVTAVMRDTIDVATGRIVATSPAPLTAPPLDLRSATSPDKKRTVASELDGTLTVTDAKGRDLTIELGTDAYVVTSKSGKSQVFGNRASARCNVGAAWLPLEACAPLLGAVSP